jgi:hypothetical protein
LEADGIPLRIDRSYWGAFMAGGLGSQTMTAMRFLGLITDPGDEPTPILERMVKADQRRQVLREVLEDRYESLFQAVDVSRATHGQLEQAFARVYKVDGETRRKSMSFFLHAAHFAEIPISTFITNKTKAPRSTAKPTNRAPVRRSRPTPTPDKAEVVSANTDSPPPASSTTSKTIQLRSGGTLTFDYDVNLFDLDHHDMDFLRDLIARINGYEQRWSGNVGTDDEELELIAENE